MQTFETSADELPGLLFGGLISGIEYTKISTYFIEKGPEIAEVYRGSIDEGLVNPNHLWRASQLMVWAYAFSKYDASLDRVCELGFGSAQVLKLLEGLFESSQLMGYEQNIDLFWWASSNVFWNDRERVHLSCEDYQDVRLPECDLYTTWPEIPSEPFEAIPPGSRIAIYHSEPHQWMESKIAELPGDHLLQIVCYDEPGKTKQEDNKIVIDFLQKH